MTDMFLFYLYVLACSPEKKTCYFFRLHWAKKWKENLILVGVDLTIDEKRMQEIGERISNIPISFFSETYRCGF
jgi:hypothetical protein